MQHTQNTIWKEVFQGWREREAQDPGWIECATKVKGWPDWESWRSFMASQFQASEREWKLYEFTDIQKEIPELLIGPYTGWQNRFQEKNIATFQDIFTTQGAVEEWRNHEKVSSIMQSFPAPTQFIGLRRADNGKIVCVEGHHRAAAFTLAQALSSPIENVKITIDLAEVPKEESDLFNKMLERGLEVKV